MDAADTEIAAATVVVEGDCITRVLPAGDPGARAATGPADRDIDADGHLLMPGLINGHFHSSVNDLKGSLDSLPLEIFMLFESPASAHGGRTAHGLYPHPAGRAGNAPRRSDLCAGRRILRAQTHAAPDRCGDAGLRRLRHPGDGGAGPTQCAGDRKAPLPA